jgi:hypothetical protein
MFKGVSRTASMISVAAAGVVLIAGCDATGESMPTPSAEPPMGAKKAVLRAADITLPLDTYYLSTEQDLVLQRATAILVGSCMRRFGFAYRPPEPYPARTVRSHARLFGLIDPVEGAKTGYHGTATADLRAQEAAEKARTAVSPSEERVLIGLDTSGSKPVPVGGGVPEGGCLREADRQVAEGGPQVDDRLPETLARRAGGRAQADSRVQQGFAAWSKCMKDRGFDYKDPWAANNDPQWRTDSPSEREKVTASADANCKRSTGLVDTWFAVTVAYQKIAIEEEAPLLQEYVKAKQSRVSKATRIASAS